jgi:putative copper export protein
VPAAAAGAGLFVAVLGLALVAGGGAPAPAAPGLPDAGPVTGWGQPVAQLTARITAVATVGTLLFAGVLCAAPDGRLGVEARSALRWASRWAAAWASATAAGALLTASSVTGVRLDRLSASSVVGVLTELPLGRAASLVVAAALVLAVGARRCTTRGWAAALLSAALLAVVLPAVLTGHSAAAEHHVLAVSSLSVHVAAATLWVGGLLALVLHGTSPAALAPTAARFSTLALVCFLATGASGAVSAWVQLGGAGALEVLGSGYGALLLAKTAALVVLGGLGWWHRRATLPRLRAGRPGAFRRFAVVEVVVMLTTVAVAVALSASPPPSPPAAAAGPGEPRTGATSPGAQGEPAPDPAASRDMEGHDHGTLSVGVLVDAERFHVSAAVPVDSTVTVYNSSTVEVTITAAGGAFDVVVPGRTFATFPAPGTPGDYPFSSRHSPRFTDVLEVGG